MQIQMTKLDKIQPYQDNAKVHTSKQIRQIADSITAFGFNQPIVVDRDGVIIVGHGRYAAALALNLPEVPVVFATGLSEAEVEAYRIADNKLNESDWNFSLVIEQLKRIETSGLDISITGFTKEIFGVKEDNFDGDKERAKIKSPRVKFGDIWALGDHRLYCGDSCDSASYEAVLGELRPRLVFTDPTYGVSYSSGSTRGDTSKHDKIANDDLSGDKLIEFLQKAFDHMFLYTSDDCCFYVWHATSTAEAFRAALELSNNSKWQIKQTLIWIKSHFVLSRSDYQHTFEPCFYGWKKGKTHFTNKNIRNFDDVLKLDVDNFADMLDVWFAARDSMLKYEHPTQKPVRLAERAIKKSSNEGDLVMDIFAGSGSTLMACEQLNRKCIAMELDPKYCDVIIKRWEGFTGNKAEKL